jgi:shikimate kinase
MKCLIHISGASGSGKSSLGARIKELKRFEVIETDDINDRHALGLIRKHELTRSKVKQLDTQQFAKLIQRSKRDVVIVGRIIDMSSVRKLIGEHKFHGFYLDVDADTVFRRLNTRHIELIRDRATEMIALLRSRKYSVDEIEALFLHEFEIRRSMPTFADAVKRGIAEDIRLAKKEKYRILKPDQILKQLARWN